MEKKVTIAIFQDFFEKEFPRITNFKVRDTDVFSAGFPKSGTYWATEMIWLIVNNLDFEKAKTRPVQERCPFLHHSVYWDYKQETDQNNVTLPPFLADSVKFTEELSDPRCIKVHCAFNLLPKQIKDRTAKAKVIYIIRNPKDVCLSAYHFERMISDLDESFEEFAKFFLSRIQVYWNNVLSYWEQRTNPNVLIVKFEDMKKDIKSTLKRVSEFVGKNYTPEQLAALQDHLSFENLKNNKSVNHEEEYSLKAKAGIIKGSGKHFRSGKVGEHKEVMPQYLIEQFDASIKKHGQGIFC